ncbi:hypothetical protein DDB_G0288595 [Dictyostelium discoideum AX4]|uniref:Thioredoxin domain-containing protein n=1 Tax=Dictyostelium discoideum TaxID=44689 RepID=Q54IQ1_DICDI|nr:hypothetical protein DDB_G0288595 [Dictyostelium discoideum AX4]EAL63157.1 hypothetical protein DDB_G0288595 [Dictyostelium discoideum AX4]|eukprot:XP_636663.1 hypothetical protein DDB_G0288595 [Dictyostelium discoideum AX4]
MNFYKLLSNNCVRSLTKSINNKPIINPKFITSNTFIKRSYFTKSPNNLYSNNYDNYETINKQQQHQHQHQQLEFPEQRNNNSNNKKEEITAESFESKPLIVELDSKNFSEVIKSKVPIILNVYVNHGTVSPALTEALKAYAQEYPGCFLLANLDVDKNLEIANALKVEQLPTLFTLNKGQVLQQFVGLPDHETLDKLVNGLLKLSGGLIGNKSIEQLQTIAELFIKSNEIEKAIEIYENLLSNDTTQLLRTLLGFIQCYTNLNEPDQVEKYLSIIKEKFPNELDHKIIQSSKRILQLKKQVSQTVDSLYKTHNLTLEQIEDKLNNDPTNLDLKYDLSLLYYQIGEYEKSINQLLEILKINKKFTPKNDDQSNTDSAKNLIVKIFESLDSQDPLVIKSRKQLNNIWFS